MYYVCIGGGGQLWIEANFNFYRTVLSGLNGGEMGSRMGFPDPEKPFILELGQVI